MRSNQQSTYCEVCIPLIAQGLGLRARSAGGIGGTLQRAEAVVHARVAMGGPRVAPLLVGQLAGRCSVGRGNLGGWVGLSMRGANVARCGREGTGLLLIFLSKEKRHLGRIAPRATSGWIAAPSKMHPVCRLRVRVRVRACGRFGASSASSAVRCGSVGGWARGRAKLVERREGIDEQRVSQMDGAWAGRHMSLQVRMMESQAGGRRAWERRGCSATVFCRRA